MSQLSPQPLLASGRYRLVSPASPRYRSVGNVLLLVVPEVTALAERSQVASLPVRGVVIEVGHREDDANQLGIAAEPPPQPCVRRPIDTLFAPPHAAEIPGTFGVVGDATPLAAVAGLSAHLKGDRPASSPGTWRGPSASPK